MGYKYYKETICKRCGKVELLDHRTVWYREKKGSGMCRSCAGIESENKNKWKKGMVAWNKGLKGFNKGHKPYYIAWGEDNSFYGKKHSEKTKEKMRLTKLGKVGDKANNWQGGKTQGQQERMLKKYKDWRMNIYKRDGFRCQICKKTGEILNAHHIKSWAKYPKLRYKLSNGITLCKKCHYLIHNKN